MYSETTGIEYQKHTETGLYIQTDPPICELCQTTLTLASLGGAELLPCEHGRVHEVLFCADCTDGESFPKRLEIDVISRHTFAETPLSEADENARFDARQNRRGLSAAENFGMPGNVAFGRFMVATLDRLDNLEATVAYLHKKLKKRSQKR